MSFNRLKKRCVNSYELWDKIKMILTRRHFFASHRHLVLTGVFLCLIFSGWSQIPTALSTGKGAGINRILSNPATGVHSDYPWEFNLVDAHLFFQSDYGFVRKASLLNLGNQLRDATVIEGRTDLPQDATGPLIIFDLDGGNKDFFVNTRINGPAINFNLRDGFRVGLFSSLRIRGGAPNIPESFGVYELNASFNTNEISVTPTKASAAAWLEYGLNFSRQLDNLSFGVNIKFAQAYEAFYLNNSTNATYDFRDSTVTVTSPIAAEFALTTPTINSNSLQTDAIGRGIAFDLGVAGEINSIKWGASILDIGSLQLDVQTEVYGLNTLSNITEIPTENFRGVTTFREVLDLAQTELGISPEEFGVFSVGMPTRIRLYGEYYWQNDIHFSGELNQRIPLFGNSIPAINSLVLTPRIEKEAYSLFLPITVYEYKSVRLGTAVRWGPLTLGTDHLTSVFFPSDFRGSDVYFSLNLFPWWSSERNGRRGGGIPCPQF